MNIYQKTAVMEDGNGRWVKKGSVQQLGHAYSKIPKYCEIVHIYYGSQMGTGEGFAEDLCDYLNSLNIRADVKDIDEFDEEVIIHQQYCIFFFSTYGNGQPTRSSKAFFEWMKANGANSTLMKKVKYAIFGLGDSNYPQYQAASILADKRLKMLGATQILELTKGNAAEDIDGDFEQWRSIIVEKLNTI